MSKMTSAMRKHYKKFAAAVVPMATLLYTETAMAAMDVTTAVADIEAVEDPVSQIAAGTVGVLVVMYGWRKAKGAIR